MSELAIEKFCDWCGEYFIATSRNQKYCCEECYRRGRNLKTQMNRVHGLSKKKFAQRQMAGIKTGKLDERLDEARSKGLTYAELQKQKTLALYGGFNNEH